MSNLAFDTHKFITDLSKAGMSTEQAEVLANHYASLLNDRIATKDDMRLLQSGIDSLRTELKADIGSVRTELTGDIAAMEERLNRRLVTGQLTTILAVCAVLGTLMVLIQP